MARSDSFQKKWAAVPSQFERPSDALIDRGWAGGAAEDPPEAKWENWWHNRVDEALAEIESNGALQWFANVPYGVGVAVSHSGLNWISAIANSDIEPGSANDAGHWYAAPTGLTALHGRGVYSSAGTHTWAVPAGVTKVLVTVVGGGGAGGKTSTTAVAPSGGGGGMTSGIVDVSGVATVAITVGAGGAASVAAGVGGNGSASSFGSYLSATGGSGNPTDKSGGTGGTGSGGDVSIQGGAGAPSANAAGVASGPGGASALAPGGVCSLGSFDAAQHNGRWPGGGGGGVSSNASQSGAGADGAVIIEW